jgi:hypothetical protein
MGDVSPKADATGLPARIPEAIDKPAGNAERQMVKAGENGRSWFGEATGTGSAPRCEVSEDGKTVIHGRADWAERFPVEELERRAAFYRRMSETYRHPSYAQDTAVLEAALEALRARVAA